MEWFRRQLHGTCIKINSNNGERYRIQVQSNPALRTPTYTEGTLESVLINRLSVLSGLNLEKMKGLGIRKTFRINELSVKRGSTVPHLAWSYLEHLQRQLGAFFCHCLLSLGTVHIAFSFDISSAVRTLRKANEKVTKNNAPTQANSKIYCLFVREGIPGNFWCGCAARLFKSWPSFRLKTVIFHNRSHSRLLESNSVFRSGMVEIKSSFLDKHSNKKIS